MKAILQIVAGALLALLIHGAYQALTAPVAEPATLPAQQPEPGPSFRWPANCMNAATNVEFDACVDEWQRAENQRRYSP